LLMNQLLQTPQPPPLGSYQTVFCFIVFAAISEALDYDTLF